MEAFGEGRAFGPRISIMVEAEERHIEDVEHLERHVCLQARMIHAAAEPWPFERLPAERIAARPGEAVPVGQVLN